jgi:hypothetical protein
MEDVINKACNVVLEYLSAAPQQTGSIERALSLKYNESKPWVDEIEKRLQKEDCIEIINSGFGEENHTVRIKFNGLQIMKNGGYPIKWPDDDNDSDRTRIGGFLPTDPDSPSGGGQ